MIFRNSDFSFSSSRSLPWLGDQGKLCGWERPEWLSHHMVDGGPGECPDSQPTLHKQDTHLCCVKPLCLLGGLFPQRFLSCHDYCMLELTLHKQDTHLCCVKPLCLLGGLFPQCFLSCHDYCMLECLAPLPTALPPVSILKTQALCSDYLPPDPLPVCVF